MVHRGFVCYVLPPLVVLELHVWAVQCLGTNRHGILFAENGPIELGTAAGFLTAAALAVRLILSCRDRIPRAYRCLFILFAIAATFVALEELSYGQHLFGWNPPDFFVRHSTKNELNLHNLYGDSLSNVLRLIANLGFPFGCVVLPLVALQKPGRFQVGRWAYYLSPRLELAATVLLAEALSPLDKLAKTWVGTEMINRSGEVQELFWSFAACFYVFLIHRRIVNAEIECDVLPFESVQAVRLNLRKAA